MVDSGGREQQIVIQGGGWNVLVPEALSLLGSGEYLTTRSVLRTHVHLAADGSQSSRRTTSYLLHPIYTRSINDINVHISITADSYFGRLFVKERTWSFHISFSRPGALSLLFPYIFLVSSRHGLECNRSISP